MKYLLVLAMVGTLGACVSTAEFDRDQAYSRCDKISDPSSRNRCIADAIQKAERERVYDSERQKQHEDDAERRELGREIAGAEKD
jgi:2-phosphoglycerate kinase